MNKIITKDPSEEVVINENEIHIHSFDFMDCPTIEFVINPEEENEVWIVDFELYGIGKSYHIEEGKVYTWSINEK